MCVHYTPVRIPGCVQESELQTETETLAHCPHNFTCWGRGREEDQMD